MLRPDPKPDRLVVAISDIEMGAGGVTDDFPHDEWLADLLYRYNTGPWADRPVDFVFHGDTFDFLKRPGLPSRPHHITDVVGVAKLDRIADAHEVFLGALSEILCSRRAPRRAFFLLGNHDPELAFSAVQDHLRERLGLPGDAERVRFPGLQLRLGEVHFEHGSQGDPLFRVDPDKLFVDYEGRQLLALPWGSVALLATAIPMHGQLSHLDRVMPRQRVFEILPEARELLLMLMWQYWTRDFVRDLWDGDPLKSVSWTLFHEIVYRYRTEDANVTASLDAYEDLLRERGGPRLVVLGHRHSPGWITRYDRKLLVTGCLRDEFTIDRAGRTVALLPKVYAEIEMAGERVLRSQLIETRGPLPQHVPELLDEYRPRLLELLGSTQDRSALHRAQTTQVDRERR